MLLGMEKAATPSEGLEALATLQAMLLGDPAAQVCEVYKMYCVLFRCISVNFLACIKFLCVGQ